jgi:glyceraldehyde-3-phosphate dehydrogenase (NADP+)
LPEVDLDNAVNEAVTGSLSFNGQRCTALKILFVHEDVVERFIEKFNAKLATLKPGMPWKRRSPDAVAGVGQGRLSAWAGGGCR